MEKPTEMAGPDKPSLSAKTRKSSPSQCDLILEYLQAGHSLTHIEALEKFKCWALSQRVTDLRRKGHRILTQMIEVSSGKRIASYTLERDSQ